MTYKIVALEEIRYTVVYEIEARSEEEAKNIVSNETNEGSIVNQDMTYFEIIDVEAQRE